MWHHFPPPQTQQFTRAEMLPVPLGCCANHHDKCWLQKGVVFLVNYAIISKNMLEMTRDKSPQASFEYTLLHRNISGGEPCKNGLDPKDQGGWTVGERWQAAQHCDNVAAKENSTVLGLSFIRWKNRWKMLTPGSSLAHFQFKWICCFSSFKASLNTLTLCRRCSDSHITTLCMSAPCTVHVCEHQQVNARCHSPVKYPLGNHWVWTIHFFFFLFS